MKPHASLKDRFNLIKDFFINHSRMPSYAEMALLFGVSSKNAVFKIVNKMIQLNLLKKDDKGYLSFAFNVFSIKMLGFIEAGFPSPAEEELLDSVSLDRFLIENPNSTFMLKVSGDSMINAAILPGDYVIVDKSRKPKEHDIVIAQVDGKWTMKYLELDKTIKTNTDKNLTNPNHIQNYILLPANPKYKPIRPKQELIIAGVVAGVVRKYK